MMNRPHITEFHAAAGRATVTTRCPSCGGTHVLEVDAKAFVAWHCGAYMQQAFPDLTPQQREYLITGLCEECWNKATR